MLLLRDFFFTVEIEKSTHTVNNLLTPYERCHNLYDEKSEQLDKKYP